MLEVEDDYEVALALLEEMEQSRQDLKTQLDQKNQYIHELEQKLQLAQERLQRQNGLKQDCADVSVTLRAKNIQYWYADEIEYFILEALKTHKLYQQHSRFTTLVDDLHQANSDVIQRIDEDLAALKAALIGYKAPTPKLEEALKKFNIHLVSNNKHIKAKFIHGNQFFVTLGKSASDHKAGLNNYQYFTDHMLPRFK